MSIFTVREAEKKDVGKAIARLHPEDMEELQVEVGNIVQIGGKKLTAAKVWPALAEARERGTIQIDGISRENAGASLDEKVRVAKIECPSAQALTLEPVGETLLSQRDSQAVARLLELIPVCKGDRVRITPFANQYQEFVVSSLKPKGICLVTTKTRLVLAIEEKRLPGRGKSTTYEDIGGLKQELQRVREMIELPLKHPELFERLGIEAPKGVLLYGPPGCGKTLIARAIANEVAANFYKISGPEVFGRFVGQSASQVRKAFQTALASRPSILFIDEIDAMAGKREELTADKTEHLAVVNQLCDLMDGLEEETGMVVIGATNLPDLLDQALRRAGRFDREIEISVPDRDGREEILEIHTRAMPLGQDVDLGEIAARTHGFVGADIAALCREAAMASLRKVLPDIDLEESIIPPEILSQLFVSSKDFEEAAKEVSPSALREVYLEKPDVRWKDVGGLGDIKQALKEAVEWPLSHAELFDYMATSSAKGILLSGPPGCGKTLVAKALAGESEVNFISIKGPALMSKWVGETEKKIREIFHKARQHAPCIIFFDEIDAIAPRRGRDVSGVSDRTLSQILAEIDGMEALKGVVVIGATNRIDLVDEALLRPGRFDLVFELPLPDTKAREEIFEIHTRGKPLTKDVDLPGLAQITEGCSGADIANVCLRASLIAIREFVESGLEDKRKCLLSQKHFLMALEAAAVASA